jgi:membrane associated rhomboid family serine protease
MNNNQYRPTGFGILPVVVKNILIINGLFFLATMGIESAFQIDITQYFGLHYFQSEHFRPYQFVTYMFMHGGFGHIFFNMFAVWMFGNVLENVWGPKRFLIYYLITGVGAALIQTLVAYIDITPIQNAAEAYINSPNPAAFAGFVREHFESIYPQLQSFITEYNLHPKDIGMINQSNAYINDLINLKVNVPTVGASGAVFGILLAFGMMFPNSLIYVYFAIPVKAKWFVIFYGAMELYSGFANNPNDNVAHFAHLGGMLFGFFLIIYWNKKIKGKYF